jgi:hypothetical protein
MHFEQGGWMPSNNVLPSSQGEGFALVAVEKLAGGEGARKSSR